MMIFSKFHNNCHEIVHPTTKSCSYFALGVFYTMMKRSFKVYGLLYLIAALIRRRKLEYFKTAFIKHTLQSSVFLSLNGSLFGANMCLFRKIFGGFTMFTSTLLPGIISSFLAILVERSNRRALLALYMFNNALEAIFNSLVCYKIIKPLPYGEVLMFCCATALLMYYYRERRLDNAFLTKIIRLSLGEEQGTNKVQETYRNFEQTVQTTIMGNILMRCLPSFQAFSVGYLIQMVASFLRSIFKPSQIPKILVNKNNVQLGLFFGSFVSIFQFVEFLLKIIRKKGDSLNGLIAGAVSGLSLLFYKSSTISLYLFTKMAEIFVKSAQCEGYLPFIPYADIIIYTLSTAVTFHVCVMDSKNIRPGYWKFLLHTTDNAIYPASRNFPRMFHKIMDAVTKIE